MTHSFGHPPWVVSPHALHLQLAPNAVRMPKTTTTLTKIEQRILDRVNGAAHDRGERGPGGPGGHDLNGPAGAHDGAAHDGTAHDGTAHDGA